MRKLSVLTSFAALALLAAPVAKAETLLAVDPPDVNIAPGTTADGTFDLDDFFNSTSGDVSFSAVSGGSVDADGVATVDGLGNAGETTATFSGTNGTDTVEVNSSVFVSAFNIGNAPDINNNNRLAGVAGGNKFAQLVAPGGSFASAVPLSNLPQGGTGSGTGPGMTGGAMTGGAALIATVASIGLNTDPETGLRERVVNGPIAPGGNTGLTVTLNADGSYSVTAGAAFVGNHIVTLGATGDGTDAVHVLASAATELGAPFVGDHTVAPGAASLVFDPAVSVPVNGDAATVVLYYNASSVDRVAIAAIGFDGALDSSTVSFSNSSGANLEAGTTKGLATSFTVDSGSIIPALQVFNGGSAPVTVSVVRMAVSSAGPLHDFALNPNHKAASNDFSAGIGGIIPDILGAGASAPAADAANNFSTASGSGSMRLNGAGGFSNGSIITTAPQGEVAIEAYVSREGAAEAGSALALVATDGGATSISVFKPGSSIPEGSFKKVTGSGTVSVAGQIFLVIQAAGFNGIVDDVSLRAIDDRPEHFDADLLG